MRIPTWSKPLLLFVGVVSSVVLLATGFFVYTAATTTLHTPQLPPEKENIDESVLQKTTPTELPATSPQVPNKVLGTSVSQLDPNKLFLLVNAHRENFNMPKLKANPKLTASAQLKLNDMIANDYYRHADENDQSTWHFIQVAGYQYSKAGENLAFNIGSEWEIFQAWVKSETHNKQMLDASYTDIGIAIDCTSIKEPGYKCITVAHFGKE
ncbi:MAG: CAP domain-containing protein [Candidatus Pacebacteria bacterium]|nr:CAP domain-containing protein [Candidatus Paceibacterota bacterium]PIR63336.1 MAG: hypothetical protein COU64_05140 [Candidatus Pacebacteria bacterium CG10_big_fil_rev_8_21_14_0_10_40_26]PIZ79018.1 MAG: hypothetical protein COY01_01150 [Candidatus Pacebacteria bacterium CG_4_10_14_0_2_um_filter_40_20]PJA68536.1 MAG: hypothetical protein CO156_04870 [Candidatus Pacebacteria bacterium CG_4_9_14_3_um_filter_40_12]PJC41920.1 MAG: hypothetical protein CO041_02120 [Candidatus Pacebacteria bacteriu